jgi:hypothetical protein
LLSLINIFVLACRHASRVSRSITDRRRALVTVAAAESDAAPVAEQAAAPAAKRSLASIQPNEVVEGRVVSAGCSLLLLTVNVHNCYSRNQPLRVLPCRSPFRASVPLLILVLRLRASSTSHSWR